MLVLSGLAAATLRVDGSVDGRGLPRLGWRWIEREAAGARVAPAGSAALADDPRLAALGDVPQFFGPQRDGTVRGAKLARDWSAAAPREIWRQPIGLGWASFAIVDGRAFTQEQQGPEEWVSCYEALSGRLLWKHARATRFSEWQGGDGPRATPTVDRGRVFAIGATGVLDCLDAQTGERFWMRNILTEHGLENLTWGVSGSPLVFDDTVVVTGAASPGPTLLAFHRVTGEPLWKAGTDKASYASPILTTLAGRRVILSFNGATLTAHEPADGRVVLEHRWGSDKYPKAAQPAVLAGDRVFLTAGYGMGCVMLQIAAAPDGRLAATELWKGLRLKAQFNSVAERDGFLYGLDDGLLACVEAATGERRWKDGRYGSGQTLLVDDLLIVQAERGAVALVAAVPDGFRELGRIAALSSKTWNHPVLAGRYLFVRNDREAACYELPVR